MPVNHACMQFDSTALEGSISDVKVTTLELKAELGKSNQKLLALTQRMETLERRPQRTITRNHSVAPLHSTPSSGSVARVPSMAPTPGASTGPSSSIASSPSSAAGLLAAATAEAAATAAGVDTAVAPSQAVAPAPAAADVPARSGSGAGPSVNFAADPPAVHDMPAATPMADSASVSGVVQNVYQLLLNSDIIG